MALTVLNVAYPFAKVGPDAVGGAEQVLTQVDEGLVRANHNSLVLAAEGSRAHGRLIPHEVPDAQLHSETKGGVHARYRDRLQNVLLNEKIDVVHMHGIDFANYLPETTTPVLVTLHLPLDWYPREIFSKAPPNVFFHCVSKSQRRRAKAPKNLLPDVENGVPVERFPIPTRKRNYVAALGRICPGKGFHHALDAARAADVPLLLAGRVFPHAEHKRYFDSEIKPRLDAPRRFVGAAGFFTKRRLLAWARCLLVPSLVAETSSLVAMEALACGTPVIAYPSGALPDIIEDGLTGFIVQNESEMAAAIKRVGEISPELCRKRAEERFCVKRTQAAYLELYHRIVADHRAR